MLRLGMYSFSRLCPFARRCPGLLYNPFTIWRYVPRLCVQSRKKVSVTKSAPGPGVDSQDIQAPVEEEVKPQRGSHWLDLLVLAIIIVVLLGGIGKALSDSDLFAQPQNATALAGEACPADGCVKPPDKLCAGRPIKAIVGGDGRNLYYTGEHPNYQGIIAIHVERGDRWFCTEAGAKAGGFVAAP